MIFQKMVLTERVTHESIRGAYNSYEFGFFKSMLRVFPMYKAADKLHSIVFPIDGGVAY